MNKTYSTSGPNRTLQITQMLKILELLQGLEFLKKKKVISYSVFPLLLTLTYDT